MRAALLGLALLAVACELPDVSSRSALDVVERQAEHIAVAEQFKDDWSGQKDFGIVIAPTCRGTLEKAKAREAVLDRALILAAAAEDYRTAYDLWGDKTDLLKRLDGYMRQSCRGEPPALP